MTASKMDQIYDRLENLVPGFNHISTGRILRIKIGWDASNYPNLSALAAAGFKVAVVDVGARTLVLEVET